MSISGLYLGTRALQAQQIALEVTGQNIANVDTPGYTRQRADLSASTPMNKAYGQLGTGVEVTGIEQIKDEFVEAELRSQSSQVGSDEVQADMYDRVESIFNEPSDSGINKMLSKFFSGLNDLSNNPEAIGVRDAVIIQAEALTERINSVDAEMDQLRLEINTGVETTVTEINVLTKKIADLNTEIVRIEAGNLNSANDLRDQRNQAIKELSGLTDININEQTAGEVNVSIGGLNVVFGGTSYDLGVELTDTDELPVYDVIMAGSGRDVTFTGGKMHGYLESRDTNITNYKTQLDTVARGLIDEVNKIHVNGRGLNGFDTLTSENKVTSTTSALDSAGLDITPVDTSFTLSVQDGTTNPCTETSVTVAVDVSSDSLEDVRDSINTALTGAGITDVSASINSDNELVITSSDSDLTFAFSSVTSNSNNFLSAMGINTFFSGVDASTISINNTLKSNSEYLAAATTNANGDNSNALNLVQLRTQKVIGGTRTIEESYQATVVSLGADVSQSKVDAESSAGFLTQLQLKRETVSGVNLDEEAANLIKFQRAYEAAARYVSVVDQLLNVLVNSLV